MSLVAARHGTPPINTTGMTFGSCPFLIGFAQRFTLGERYPPPPFGGVLFEPLNGASLFSTAVKPRANLDTLTAHIPPNVSHWANAAPRRHTAGFYYGVTWRATTCNNVFFTGEARLAQIDITYRIYHVVMYINYWIPIL